MYAKPGFYRTISVIALLSTLLLPSAAHAQQPPPDRQTQATARRLFEEGMDLTRQERWGEALERFRQSRQLIERPSTVFNLGSTLLRLGRMIEAVQAFSDFLSIADPRRDEELRQEAMQLIGRARRAIGSVVLRINVPNATVEVDGTERPGEGTPREVQLDPGQHALRISAPNHEPHTERVEITPGGSIVRTVDLERTPERVAGSRVRIEVSPPEADVRLDGRLLPEHNSDVTPGEHNVEVSLRGWDTQRRTFQVAPGQSLDLQIVLRRPGSVFTSPIFWAITGALVVGAGVGIGLAVTSAPELYRGTTNTVLFGIERRY